MTDFSFLNAFVSTVVYAYTTVGPVLMALICVCLFALCYHTLKH